jgi:hypothetical protein
MSVEALLEKHDGYILSNKARVVIGGRQIIVGRVGDVGMQLTPEGEELIRSQVSIVIPEVTVGLAKPPARKPRAKVGS